MKRILSERSSQGPLPKVGVTGAGLSALSNASESRSCPNEFSEKSERLSFPKASTERLNRFARGETMLANLDASSDTELVAEYQ